MKLEREMMRGAGPTAVLQLLGDGEMYGYEIVESLATRSKGVFELGQSTLYPMLYNLESKALVASRQKAGPNGRMRRYYRLTTKGKKKLEKDREQWLALVKGLGALGVTRNAPKLGFDGRCRMSNVLQKTYHTPLRELFRFNLSGRLDWKSTLVNSGLPPEVQKLIHKIVTRSRMMLFEKASVAEELIAHFEDGHARGMAFSQLVAEFGDPNVAAGLIERSKIRNRPMFMKIIRGAAWGGAFLLLAYLAILAYFHMGSPKPIIDFVADTNMPISVLKEEDKAWPIYRPLWTKYSFCEGQDGRMPELWINPYGTDEGETRLKRPDDEGWPEAAAKLSEISDLLDSFRRGAKLPHLGIELYVDPNDYPDQDFAAIFPDRSKANTTQIGMFRG